MPGPGKTDQDLKHLQSRARSRWQSEQVRKSGSVQPQGRGRIKTALVLTIISSFDIHAADIYGEPPRASHRKHAISSGERKEGTERG